MKYAMILQNRVIGILSKQETEPCWPPDPTGNPIKAVLCGDDVVLGWVYEPDTGEFHEYIPEAKLDPEPTQLDRIEAAISKTQGELVNEAIDTYTIELMEEGIL